MPFDTITRNNTTRVLPFFLVLSSDHITGATGKNPSVKLSKNGAAGLTPSGAISEVDSVNLPGWYIVAANAGDADTAGPLLLHVAATGCDPADYSFEVLGYNPDDAVHLGLSALPNAAAGATGGLNPAVLLGGTASAGTTTSITLTGGVATDNTYNHATVEIIGGTGAGQVRVIVNYSGTSKIAIVDRAWATMPDNTSVFAVIGPAVMPAWNLVAGLAAAGTSTTITLTGGSATDSLYNGATLVITAGTGARQARIITGYVGSTKVATVDRAWAVTPDSTSVFVVLGTDLPATDTLLQVGANAVNGNVSGSVGSVTGAVGSVTSAVTVGTNNDKSAYSLAANAVDASQFTQAAADKVWLTSPRTLTAFGFSVTVGINSDKTGYSLVANAVDAAQFTQAAADKVWSSATRSLTVAVDILQSAADKVWVSIARTLTAFGFNVTVGANLDKTGYDLTAGSIAAIDTELSGVHGSGAWGTGTGIGTNLVTLTVQSSGVVPIASVPVTVKNSVQTAAVAVGTTDVNGQVAFNLDNGTYKVLVVSSPSYTTLPVQTLVVSGTTTATYTLSAFNPGTPTSPSLCRIFGTLRQLDGSVAVNSKVSFSLISSLPVESNDTLIVVRQIEALTDTAGYFFVDLTRSSTLLQVGTTIVPTYLVSSGEAHLHHSFTVPDASSADLLSLTLTSA